MTPNRYAWTNVGPVCIMNGRAFTTVQVRKWLAQQGITLERWARNWAEFLGYIETPLFMGESA